MLCHFRALSRQYVKSQNLARMTADSATPGRYETFHISGAGQPRDGVLVELRALDDNALIGIDPESCLQAGRAPHLELVLKKVGGKSGPAIEDGDTVVLRNPGWWPSKRYVRVRSSDGVLCFTRGKRDSATELQFVKARDILRIDLPPGGEGEGVVVLKDLEAPAGGVPIELASSNPDVVEVQRTVVVQPGERETRFSCTARPHAAKGAVDVVITAMSVATHDSVEARVGFPAS